MLRGPEMFIRTLSFTAYTLSFTAIDERPVVCHGLAVAVSMEAGDGASQGVVDGNEMLSVISIGSFGDTHLLSLNV